MNYFLDTSEGHLTRVQISNTIYFNHRGLPLKLQYLDVKSLSKGIFLL